MKKRTLCFVVDGRSPIAINWIRYFLREDANAEVHVISTTRCDASLYPGAQVYFLPLGIRRFQRAAASASPSSSNKPTGGSKSAARSLKSVLISDSHSPLRWLLLLAQRNAAIADVFIRAGGFRRIVERIRPDLIHAMRIPYEAMLASRQGASRYPLLVSIWGNDFTLHAAQSGVVRRLTRQVLTVTDALHTDCQRDAKLALTYGFDSSKPTLVVPGNGGIDRSVFFPNRQTRTATLAEFAIPPESIVFINPRGLREYIRTDMFFLAVQKIVQQVPNTYFLCTGMGGNPELVDLMAQFGIEERVRLLPTVPNRKMADFFQCSDIMVSPSTHDGTPNSLLEAMACGCFPVVSDIETMHEWIVNGENGLIFDVFSVDSLVEAMQRAVTDEWLRAGAFDVNQELIARRAEYHETMATAQRFYDEILSRRGGSAQDS